MINDIFKTPIFTKSLDIDNTAIEKYALNLKRKSKGRTVSNQGGWQSDELQGDIPVLKPLINSIMFCSESFGSCIGIKMPVKLDNIWINVNNYKDANSVHVHNYSLLSGVYYVKAPADSGSIIFYHPNFPLINYDWHKGNISEGNTYTSSKWQVPPVSGKLILFPSWLLHSVNPNLSKENRISISFNICDTTSPEIKG